MNITSGVVRVIAGEKLYKGDIVTDSSHGVIKWRSAIEPIIGVVLCDAYPEDKVDIALNINMEPTVMKSIKPRQKKEVKWISPFKSVGEARRKLRAK